MARQFESGVRHFAHANYIRVLRNIRWVTSVFILRSRQKKPCAWCALYSVLYMVGPAFTVKRQELGTKPDRIRGFLQANVYILEADSYVIRKPGPKWALFPPPPHGGS